MSDIIRMECESLAKKVLNEGFDYMDIDQLAEQLEQVILAYKLEALEGESRRAWEAQLELESDLEMQEIDNNREE